MLTYTGKPLYVVAMPRTKKSSRAAVHSKSRVVRNTSSPDTSTRLDPVDGTATGVAGAVAAPVGNGLNRGRELCPVLAADGLARGREPCPHDGSRTRASSPVTIRLTVAHPADGARSRR